MTSDANANTDTADTADTARIPGDSDDADAVDVAAAVVVPSVVPIPASVLAERASALENRMATLDAEIDATWHREFLTRSPALSFSMSMSLSTSPSTSAPSAPGLGRRSAFESVLTTFCGPLPTLDRLAADNAQIAFMRRPVALRALCLLALARRPGVLRCCIDRSQKEQLQQNLGDALAAVEALGVAGRAVSHEATGWTPLHWSCLGYLDWLSLMTRDDTFLRRLVRLLLPRGLLEMSQRLHLARADMPSREAVARLGAAGVRWPC